MPRWPSSPSSATRSMASGTTPSHPTSSHLEAVISRRILRRISMFFRHIEKVLVATGVLLALGSGVTAGEIKVLTTGILKGSFTQIAAQFERETGHKVIMSWGP